MVFGGCRLKQLFVELMENKFSHILVMISLANLVVIVDAIHDGDFVLMMSQDTAGFILLNISGSDVCFNHCSFGFMELVFLIFFEKILFIVKFSLLNALDLVELFILVLYVF